MKNIFKLLFVSLLILPFSCHESDNVVDDLIEPINEIKKVSIPRFVLLMSTAAILFLFYVYYSGWVVL